MSRIESGFFHSSEMNGARPRDGKRGEVHVQEPGEARLPKAFEGTRISDQLKVEPNVSGEKASEERAQRRVEVD